MADLTSLEAIDIVYSVLEGTLLFGAVGGNFFKGGKPLDFVGECVVINALPMTGDQLQVCRIMVNIHVPNLETRRNGESEFTQANYIRIQELTVYAKEALKDYDANGYSIRLEQEYTIENKEFNEHFNNIRTIFRNENI